MTSSELVHSPSDVASSAPATVPVPAPARPARLLAVLFGMTVLVLLLSVWNLSRGEPNVSFAVMLDGVLQGEAANDATAGFLIRELRLPRLLLALLIGAALAVAGTIMQNSLRNPIADPSLLGISQAASFAVAITLLFPGFFPPVGRPVLCLIAGLGTGAVLVLLSRTVRDPIRLILVGVILAMLWSMLTSVVLLLAPDYVRLAQFFTFTTGSVSATTWQDIRTVAPWLILALPAGLMTARTLNLLQLGDDLASGLGLRVVRARFLLLFVAMLLVAPAVAVAGPIGFVALLSPHVARFLLRTSNSYQVLPASAAIGAVIVLAADSAGRLLFFPTEIPAGIWTIVVAGPIAIWLSGAAFQRARS